MSGRDMIGLTAAHDIELIISTDISRGWYYYSMKKHTIVLSAHLSPERRAWEGWHEFGHFLQNYREPKVTISASGLTDCDDPHKERLANIFANLAMYPDNVRITRPMMFIEMLMEGTHDSLESRREKHR